MIVNEHKTVGVRCPQRRTRRCLTATAGNRYEPGAAPEVVAGLRGPRFNVIIMLSAAFFRASGAVRNTAMRNVRFSSSLAGRDMSGFSESISVHASVEELESTLESSTCESISYPAHHVPSPARTLSDASSWANQLDGWLSRIRWEESQALSPKRRNRPLLGP